MLAMGVLSDGGERPPGPSGPARAGPAA